MNWIAFFFDNLWDPGWDPCLRRETGLSWGIDDCGSPLYKTGDDWTLPGRRFLLQLVGLPLIK